MKCGPFITSGNRDCLFNAVSLLLYGDESKSVVLWYHMCLYMIRTLCRSCRGPTLDVFNVYLILCQNHVGFALLWVAYHQHGQ